MSKTFLISLKEYLYHFTDLWNIWFPLMMMGSFVLLMFIITLIYAGNKQGREVDEKPKTTTLKIFVSMYWSGIITLLGASFVVIYLAKFTTFFGYHFSQMGIIIGYLLIGIFTFYAYSRICRKTKKKAMSLLNVPISNTALNQSIKSLQKTLTLLLWCFLFVAAPFLLLLISNKQQSLVSVVLDNSGSMYEYLPYGINSLETVLAASPHQGQYVFTTLTINKNKAITDTNVNQYFNTIVNTQNPNDLPTSTEIFSNSRELINAFSQVDDAGGSAIYQGIWQNYLEARNLANHSFKSKKMIVISDGNDDLYYYASLPGQGWNKKDIFQQPGQVDESPYEFYTDGIYCINLGENNYENLYADCAESIEIYDGTNQRSYFNALVDILPEMFFDWILIYIIGGILALTFLALFISKSVVK